MSLENVTVEAFEPMVGEAFRVMRDDGEPAVFLKLVSATKYGSSERPFSLVFEGSSEFPYPQQILRLEQPSGVLIELFLVPLSDNATLRRYEAVFN